MHLPDQLTATIIAKTNAQPVASARALYDLDGNLADTFVVATEPGLWVCSRRLGEPFAAQSWPWADVTALAVHAESVFAHLTWTTPDRPCALKFSSWDAPHLESIRRVWLQHERPNKSPASMSAPAFDNKSDTTEITPPTGLLPTPTLPAPDIPSLTPLEFFCAAIHAVVEADDHIDMAELNYLSQRLQNKTAIQRGHAFLQQHGLDKLLAKAPRVLNAKQGRCLFANLVAVTMLDGLLKPVEMDLLDTFQAALHISQEDRQQIWELLLTKHRLAVFAEPAREDQPRDGLTPLTAFCGAVNALIGADRHVAALEQDYLERCVPDAATVQAGRRYLATFGVQHLAARAADVLTDDQKRCLLANLFALAMIDGAIDPREQTVLDLFIVALGLPPEDNQAMLDLIILKNNLGVLDR